jgi:hypothetical protein
VKVDYAANKLSIADILTHAVLREQLEELFACVGQVDVARNDTYQLNMFILQHVSSQAQC